MVIIGGTIRFDAQDRAATLDGIQRMMDASRAEEGCLVYTFSADISDPGLLHLFEVWTDEAALDAHRETPHMATFREETFPKFTHTEIKRYAAEELG